jgi:poly-gamma-glutamate synthesis protein (capsule biosynthesis protein)
MGLALSLALAAAAAAAPCESAPTVPAATHLPSPFSFAAVGDMIIQRPALKFIRARAPQIAQHLSQADVGFGNFESNSFDLESFHGHARAPPDGPLLLAPPEVPRELKKLGFALVSTANNHAGDWGLEGVMATAHTLAAAGLVSAGTGGDLRAARAAACVSVKGSAVALIAVTSSFENADAATAERGGVSALHVTLRNDSYQVDETDRQQVLDAVRQARAHAALVWVSLHTHQGGTDPERPTEFEVNLAHDVIDAGADLFVGHGPHQLRGVEIYKGHAIFYSLANFAVMQPLPKINPKPLVLPPGSIFTRRAFFESVLATGRYEHGRLVEVRLYPFELAATDEPETHGLPQAVTPAAGRAILERMQALSQALGTSMRLEDGAGVVRIPAR